MANPARETTPTTQHVRWCCAACHFVFTVGPLAPDRRGIRQAAFYAGQTIGRILRGQRFYNCPRCRREFPTLTWEDFLAEAEAGFTP